MDAFDWIQPDSVFATCYLDAVAGVKAMTIKPEVLAAMERMCTPLDESVLCGATANADALNMELICTELHRLDKELEAANALLLECQRTVMALHPATYQRIQTHLQGAGDEH